MRKRTDFFFILFFLFWLFHFVSVRYLKEIQQDLHELWLPDQRLDFGSCTDLDSMPFVHN